MVVKEEIAASFSGLVGRSQCVALVSGIRTYKAQRLEISGRTKRAQWATGLDDAIDSPRSLWIRI